MSELSLTPRALAAMTQVREDLKAVADRHFDRLGTDVVGIDLRVVRGASILIAMVLDAFTGAEGTIDAPTPAPTPEQLEAAREADDVLWLRHFADETDDADCGEDIPVIDAARLRRLVQKLEALRGTSHRPYALEPPAGLRTHWPAGKQQDEAKRTADEDDVAFLRWLSYRASITDADATRLQTVAQRQDEAKSPTLRGDRTEMTQAVRHAYDCPNRRLDLSDGDECDCERCER